MKSTRPEPGAVIGLLPLDMGFVVLCWDSGDVKTPETYHFEPKRLEVDGRCVFSWFFLFQSWVIFLGSISFFKDVTLTSFAILIYLDLPSV